MPVKKIILLGATGSIGEQTLQILNHKNTEYQLVACAVHSNIQKAFEIIQKYHVKNICVYDKIAAEKLRQQCRTTDIKIYDGLDGLIKISQLEADLFVNALVGSVGVQPTIAAIETGKIIALANKETLVCAGEYVMDLAKKKRTKILPIDSEHSAIFQCLEPQYEKELKQIILTASGGSLRDYALSDLKEVTKEQVLAHPNWSMGNKITVDSATMMNKGFEVIEAHWLFNIPYEQIKVTLHKQSVIHSLVEYIDGSILAHLGQTDMRIPIQYALTYPKRFPLEPSTAFSWDMLHTLTLEPLDFKRYPALSLAYEAGKKGGTYPTVLNAANEVAVQSFLAGTIPFIKITDFVMQALDEHIDVQQPTIEQILSVDLEVRRQVLLNIERSLNI